jgi:hypothetical protein
MVNCVANLMERWRLLRPPFYFCSCPTCFNTVCDRWNGNAWLGLEVDEVFIHHSQGKDGEATPPRRSHTAGEGDGGRGKGLQLRLELGNVVTGEGEEGRVVVGD